MTSAVAFSGVTRHFGPVVALAGVDLDIRPGEFFAMLGPSGSGKTTCLRLIAGFDQPSSGTIAIFGERADGVPPYRRAVNTVFQDYALFPHMSVIDNVAYGPKMRGVSRGERLAEAERLLALVRLDGMASRKPQALSGGQRQRVALARALINRPKVLLLDEPLAALDLKLRVDMQGELKGLQQRLGITFVFVTHDQTEALSMADRVAVFDRGRIQQVGTPEAIYERPATPFVADFVGGANVIEPAQAGRLGLPAGLWSLRAEAIRLEPDAAAVPTGTHAVPARIAVVAYQGASRRYTLEADGLTLSASTPAAEPALAPGQSVTALVPLDALRPMVA